MSDSGQDSIRDTLYGDMPLTDWPSDGSANGFPWDSFAEARQKSDDGDSAGAIELWQQIAASPELESRHTLQAWHFLSANGVQPPADIAKSVLGVVFEVSLPEGLDLLAAYRDHSARYYNQGGGGVVWEHADESLDELIDQLISTGQAVADRIGPWKGERLSAPTGDLMRMSFLTPSGLHFGQAPMDQLSGDPLAGPVIAAGIELMQAMIEKAG
jgi:hypothetical protein